ncbi:MAG: DNA N-6-adenine-methyltransferase [Bradyrhizobium sp.]|uniref:DNA N-6-adenine-methyltransferase n=1 Tax=Bradyrhizobium sp. TaxID=376 RepID=UPI003D13046D
MSLGSHQRSIGASQVHITPLRVIEATGPFDLDPCAADPRPWDCAAMNYTESEDGLTKPWFGRVWLNPPFHRYQVGQWIGRLARHGRGTALLHARTETAWFRQIWDEATGLLFLFQRLIFHRPDGSLCTTKNGEIANSGAPPVLVAFGMSDADRLAFCAMEGAFVPLRLPRSVILALADATWREVVADWLQKRRGPVQVAELYRAFAEHPKARANPHWREKVRQTLYRGAGRRVGRNQWVAA